MSVYHSLTQRYEDRNISLGKKWVEKQSGGTVLIKLFPLCSFGQNPHLLFRVNMLWISNLIPNSYVCTSGKIRRVLEPLYHIYIYIYL